MPKTKGYKKWAAFLLLIPTILTTNLCADWGDPWQFWNTDQGSETHKIDHSRWQEFLNETVKILEDGQTAVDYKSINILAENLLEQYLNEMSLQDPRKFSPTEQMAYWVNVYNALTVMLVHRNQDKSSILNMGNDLFSRGPWDDNLIQIMGKMLTLNDIEHRILRAIWKDHRIHFVLNCASKGCPNLSQFAYTGTNMEADLAAAEDTFLHQPKGLSFDKDGVLHLSSIFSWYQSDFAPNETQLLSYLANIRPELSPKLLDYRSDITYKYNWQLNSLPE
ncbi:MAG: DUF547 domain-containing protein [Pseudomonadales bacterium]|nr:DUF547 domain-containing protein [Pseudomonadales bacterium]